MKKSRQKLKGTKKIKVFILQGCPRPRVSRVTTQSNITQDESFTCHMPVHNLCYAFHYKHYVRRTQRNHISSTMIQRQVGRSRPNLNLILESQIVLHYYATTAKKLWGNLFFDAND